MEDLPGYDNWKTDCPPEPKPEQVDCKYCLDTHSDEDMIEATIEANGQNKKLLFCSDRCAKMYQEEINEQTKGG